MLAVVFQGGALLGGLASLTVARLVVKVCLQHLSDTARPSIPVTGSLGKAITWNLGIVCLFVTVCCWSFLELSLTSSHVIKESLACKDIALVFTGKVTVHMSVSRGASPIDNLKRPDPPRLRECWLLLFKGVFS